MPTHQLVHYSTNCLFVIAVNQFILMHYDLYDEMCQQFIFILQVYLVQWWLWLQSLLHAPSRQHLMSSLSAMVFKKIFLPWIPSLGSPHHTTKVRVKDDFSLVHTFVGIPTPLDQELEKTMNVFIKDPHTTWPGGAKNYFSVLNTLILIRFPTSFVRDEW